MSIIYSKTKKNWGKNQANIITLTRMFIFILFTIYFVFYYFLLRNKVSKENNILFCSLFLIVYFYVYSLDYVDGFVARKLNIVSKYGKIFDQIFDKIISNSILLFFILLHWINFVPLILFIFRDFYLSGLRNYYTSDTKNTLPADKFGKIKMIVLGLAIMIIIIFGIINSCCSWKVEFHNKSIYFIIANIGIFIALLLSYLSVFNYTLYIKKNK